MSTSGGSSDAAAHFESFYRANYVHLLAFFVRRVDDMELARDLTGEAFRVLWSRWDDEAVRHRGWLFAVGRNLVGDEWRHRARAARLEPLVDAPTQGDEQVQVDVRVTLAGLADIDRAVLTLTYWDGLSATEVGSAAWLNRTTQIARTASGWKFIDAAGAVTARLTRDGPATTQYARTAPTVNPDDVPARQDSVRGPGVTDTATDALAGVWLLPGVPRADAFITFTRGGRWKESTRCPGPIGSPTNSGDGPYRLLADGTVLLLSGLSNLTVCGEAGTAPSEAVRTFRDLWKVRSVRFDGTSATLFDSAGRTIGRLVRAS